jgi:hypothetical protein
MLLRSAVHDSFPSTITHADNDAQARRLGVVLLQQLIGLHETRTLNLADLQLAAG